MRERVLDPMPQELAAARDGRLRLVARPLKQQPKPGAPLKVCPWEAGITAFKPGQFGLYREGKPIGMWGLEAVLRCPFGIVGDGLWLRGEPWMVMPTPGCTFGEAMMGRKLSVFYRDGSRKDLVGGTIDSPGLHVDLAAVDYPFDKYGLWRPRQHMPRWAARHTFRIASVDCRRATREDGLPFRTLAWFVGLETVP